MCQRYGWTPTELYAQDAQVIEDFITIMDFDAKAENQRRQDGERSR